MPPQSPDLSPIEIIWNVMKMKLKAMKPRPRSKDAISAAMHQIWLQIDDDTRKKTCELFRDKLRKCLEVKGHTIFSGSRKHKVHRHCETDFDTDDSMGSVFEE